MSWFNKEKQNNYDKDRIEETCTWLKNLKNDINYYELLSLVSENKIHKTKTYIFQSIIYTHVSDYGEVQIHYCGEYILYKNAMDLVRDNNSFPHADNIRKTVKEYKNKIAKNSKRIVEINYQDHTITIKD